MFISTIYLPLPFGLMYFGHEYCSNRDIVNITKLLQGAGSRSTDPSSWIKPALSYLRFGQLAQPRD